MFPQPQQPRNEMYEYPMDLIPVVGLLERRLNYWNDVLIYRVLTLENLRKQHAENPTAAKQMKNQQTGQIENVSITAQITDQIEVVKDARTTVENISRMLELAKEDKLSELYSDEVLTPPAIDTAISSDALPADMKPEKGDNKS